MVSHNSGTNLFWFENGQDLAVSHCSVLHNNLIGKAHFFHIGSGVVHLEQSNFIENKFTVKGKLGLDAKIVIDFDLTSRLFRKADIINMENAFKVLWIEAGMAQMQMWACWALGKPSPSGSQSPPPIDGGDKRESGIATFLVLSVVAGIPTVLGYCGGRDLKIREGTSPSSTHWSFQMNQLVENSFSKRTSRRCFRFKISDLAGHDPRLRHPQRLSISSHYVLFSLLPVFVGACCSSIVPNARYDCESSDRPNKASLNSIFNVVRVIRRIWQAVERFNLVTRVHNIDFAS
jgi:hypothetical protein